MIDFDLVNGIGWTGFYFVRVCRVLLDMVNVLEEDGYEVIPDCPEVTYVDARTTLDYVIVSYPSEIGPYCWKVEENLLCQHQPVTASVKLLSQLPSMNLLRREPNLVFPATTIPAVREHLLVTQRDLFWGHMSVDEYYQGIVNSFCFHGLGQRPNLENSRLESWWKFVSIEDRLILRDLEDDMKFLAVEWARDRTLFSVAEVVDFRHHFNVENGRIRSDAEVKIQELMPRILYLLIRHFAGRC